jgi:hypothetical protein
MHHTNPVQPVHPVCLEDCVADLSDYRWLVSSEAVPFLETAAELVACSMRAVERLRKDLSPSRVGLVLGLTQSRRRASSGGKFAAADQLFFTPRSLEQATGRAIAQYKAQRFADRENVADLCCGSGGDLLAMAERTRATGVDSDPVVALFAEANCRAAGVSATVRCEPVEQTPLTEYSAWHIDPDRRPGDRRVSRVEFCQPPLAAIEAMLRTNSRAAIKLSPAADVPTDWRERAELEWISQGGECKQQVAWFGDLANKPGSRRATKINTDGESPEQFVGEPNRSAPVADTIGRHVFDPDPALSASRLLGDFANRNELSVLSNGASYFTADQPLATPWLQSFEIAETLPCDLRKLKSYLHTRHVGRLEIKQRGVKEDLDAIRKRLRLRGDREATLLLAKHDGRVVAMIANRCESHK